jgi:thiamine biosynthesis lipoprotein
MILAVKVSSLVRVCLLAPALILVASCERHGSWHFSGAGMGTRYHITVVPTNSASNGDYARLKHSFARMSSKLDNALSTYSPTSDVSRFNHATTGQWHETGADTIALAVLSKELHLHSNGTFDAGVGELVQIWGFGAYDSQVVLAWTPPDSTTLAEVRERSGIRWLDIDPAGQRLRKTKNLALDFSAIAKGYAVDKMAEILHASDYRDYLLEYGGEIRSGGHNSNGRAWRVGVVAPNPDTPMANEVYYLIHLNDDLALATSGEYRNHIILDGQRYSHTINPATGMPIAHEWGSVTVLHRSSAHADAWATALNVMGYKDGLDFANRGGLMALFIYREEQTGTLAHQLSEHFPRDIGQKVYKLKSQQLGS